MTFSAQNFHSKGGKFAFLHRGLTINTCLPRCLRCQIVIKTNPLQLLNCLYSCTEALISVSKILFQLWNVEQLISGRSNLTHSHQQQQPLDKGVNHARSIPDDRLALWSRDHHVITLLIVHDRCTALLRPPPLTSG